MPSISGAAQEAYGESTFTCPGIEIASSLATHLSPLKTWNYRYNVWDAQNEAAGLGVPHVAEKPAIFGPGNSGACNNCSSPEWKPWGDSGGQRLRFQLNATSMESVPGSQSDRCIIWKGLAQIMEQ
ncbi:uncharacterized protein N7498_001308 [Penicillium cinerascens]|uniref:Uncharacterized protein n=1 Tax=Penicillium cinerascens TaxID=70096 RepID=A0A9W9NFV7_9EURO|nr:uncharacterized protein N7498_001308 [Penicillium cinerascens]KAJ5219209.1 hypothetical protein N7498_001308 [Penicillium cinerascens]